MSPKRASGRASKGVGRARRRAGGRIEAAPVVTREEAEGGFWEGPLAWVAEQLERTRSEIEAAEGSGRDSGDLRRTLGSIVQIRELISQQALDEAAQLVGLVAELERAIDPLGGVLRALRHGGGPTETAAIGPELRETILEAIQAVRRSKRSRSVAGALGAICGDWTRARNGRRER